MIQIFSVDIWLFSVKCDAYLKPLNRDNPRKAPYPKMQRLL